MSMLLVLFCRPRTETEQALRALDKAGLYWNSYTRTITNRHYGAKWFNPFTWRTSSAGWGSSIHNLDSVTMAIRLFDPQTVYLNNSRELQNLEGLRGAKSLREIDLTGCSSLVNLDGLSGLVRLESLNLASCTSLANMNGINGHPALRMLTIGTNMQNAKIFAQFDLPSLVTLDFYYCTNLNDFDGLDHLHNLYRLGIIGGTALHNIEGVRGLAKLQILEIGDCPSLRNLDGVEGLIELKELSVQNCIALDNVEALMHLKNLHKLVLVGSEKLPPDIWPTLITWLPNTEITFPNNSHYFPIHPLP